MDPTYYGYLSTGKVQCPKCRNMNEISLYANTGQLLEYFGVCESQIETGGTCATTLALQVTAHLFPAQQA